MRGGLAAFSHFHFLVCRILRLGAQVALGELEVLARDNGVQGEGGAGEDFAGVAVAQDGVLTIKRMLVPAFT